MRVGFLFPGQGAQYAGMGRNLLQFPEARRVFEAADESLGFPLTDTFNGPEARLSETPITQPAILTVSIAIWSVLRERGFTPAVCAGHSLGEYSALVAAGSIDFSHAVRLVHERGRLMQEACPEGSMLAVLGMEREAVLELCRETGAEAANFNSSGQIVVAGLKANLEAFSEKAREKGARKIVPLAVSGPFHSSHLRPAAGRLEALLNDIPVRDPQVPVVANSNCELLKSAEAVRSELVRQIYSPVYWEDSMRIMIGMGITEFVEVGPGKVLAGLARRIDREVDVLSTDGEIDVILQRTERGAGNE